MARKSLFNIADADIGRPAYNAAAVKPHVTIRPIGEGEGGKKLPSRPQGYREGKRAVMFFLSDEAFSQMHVLLARQGRKKVQLLMEELVDDWFRQENAPSRHGHLLCRTMTSKCRAASSVSQSAWMLMAEIRTIDFGFTTQGPQCYGIHTFDWAADWAARAKPAAMAANCAQPARMVLGPGGL